MEPHDTPELDDEKRVQVVVLGDIGRSPRMQYHALSLAKHGFHVDLVGYSESHLHPGIGAHREIHVSPLTLPPAWLKTKNRILFSILGPLKTLFQIWTLWSHMYLKAERSGWMLVQNPPTIPTLAIALLACRLRKTRLVIDWHNFGYTLLSLKLGQNHPLVAVSRLYEQHIGRYAYAHLCVSSAMARALKETCHIDHSVFTLHDRPALTFQSLDEPTRALFLDKLADSLTTTCNPDLSFCDIYFHQAGVAGLEAPVHPAEALMQSLKDRKARLIVSPTSWTADEDFSLLLSAFLIYSEHAKVSKLPFLVVIITGRGPGKAAFERRVDELYAHQQLSHVFIITGFFDDLKDYASQLGCADLGISLHTSSSGVDLPMKVLDMFGAGIPVAGWSEFEAWPELVQEGVNGLGFGNAGKLNEILQLLFSKDPTMLEKLQKGALEEGKRRWDEEWDPVGERLFEVDQFRNNT
ncbi:uncharacterized protein KY384_007064 [Bacidia gigantensis]|uniref:uncharacterized protein n=1 Tax=Bacidia gigantensis TaxID=2732470 RepID=UPI001D04569A|nr:uncharacterized protein KY384_007064 [Bacidia gigantensis]KAG8528148.1 hypothetical protein KY384_007064 [Bacidia gigantensis]